MTELLTLHEALPLHKEGWVLKYNSLGFFMWIINCFLAESEACSTERKTHLALKI